MNKYAIVNYNMYCNFTNYGSSLHTYALHRVINNLDPHNISSIVLDYCPDVLADKDVLNPIKNLWEPTEETIRMCELSMPAIRINNEKFKKFYKNNYIISSQKYTSKNFNESLTKEGLSGYICGSDTIWDIQEFKGFDNGYFGNYDSMKNSHTISYAASLGDGIFEGNDLITFKNRLQNFKAISVRESTNIDFIKKSTSVLVERVLDPTLLLTGTDYNCITAKRLINEPYILLYVRRYNKAMEEYADSLAKKLNCKIVEISLREPNKAKHIMAYDAGVEEFISLVKHAEYVVTNSFHGAIFGILMHTQIRVFTRERANTKIDELLKLLNLEDYKFVTGFESEPQNINFDLTEAILYSERKKSIDFLKKALINTKQE